MPALPQRQTLVTQLTAIMRREIARGTWRDWLPNERTLSESLQVSRNTLRTALEALQREGVIRAMHGSGNRILATPTKGRVEPRSSDVAILSPEPIERLRPNFTLWIDRLRIMCGAKGYRLRVLHGRQYFRTNPGSALHRLLRQQPPSCWILILGGKPTQRWFESNRVPCVIAGTVHLGIDLPYCSQDHRTMAFDAARRMFALGHTKIALLTRRSGLAVNAESEIGFQAAAAVGGSEPKRESIVSRHDDTVPGVCQQVRQLMRQNPPPTALLVTNAHYHLSVMGCLQQLGKRVPDDVSIVSRTDDPFLEFIAPTAARYATRPQEMAGGLLTLVEPFLAGGKFADRAVHIPPRFLPGESLGPAPNR